MVVIVTQVGDSNRAAGLDPGTRLGRYVLVRRLAVGGMAELYLAQQQGAAGFAKLVALKRILPHLAENPTFTGMFLDEARLASGLDHPNLAHVLDFGESQGEHFLTMEYVHGRDLLQMLRATGEATLPLACALSIVTLVGRGLHALHEQRAADGRPMGLVHRDVSPSNVLVSFDGKVKLTDFGIAKAMELTSATRSGSFKGKLGHSSPEQARGEDIDRRSDVFCLGILLYEATTGARAFSGANEFAVLGKVARGDYVPAAEIVPGYPSGLAEIVDRALLLEPSDRYPNARAVAADIDAYADTAGLTLNTEVIADAMTALFGPAPPVLADGELRLAVAEPTHVVPSQPPVPPSRTRPTALLVAVPAALLVGAVGALALARPEAPSPAAPAAVEPAAIAPTERPNLQAGPDAPRAVAPAATPESTPEPPSEPPPDPPPEPSAAEADVLTPSVPKEPEPRPRKKRKKKKKAVEAPRMGGLYPPGR